MLYRSHSKILGRRNTLSGVERLAYGVVLSVAVALSAASAWADDSAEEGLWQKSFSGWTTTADPSVGGTLVPGALLASCAGSTYTYNGVTYSMGDSQTWAYSGVMYMNGGVTYRFVKNYDDNGCIIITDPDTDVKTTVILSTSYTDVKYGTYTPVNDGYYPIYLAVYNGNGGKGPVSAPFNNASQLGAGLAWTDDPSATDCTTSNYQKWHKFINDPDDPIFYTAEPPLTPLRILRIPDQSLVGGAPQRPEFVVTNRSDGQSWRIGGDITNELFDVEYTNNTSFGIATVTVTVKSGELVGTQLKKRFKINSDEFFSFEDLHVRRLQVGDDCVYVVSNAVSSQKITAKTGVTLTGFLLVGGGGSGGNTMGGGGGGGGVLAQRGLDVGLWIGESITYTVGAGGVSPVSGQSRGTSGGNSVITVAGTTYTAKGGGAGGAWGVGYRAGLDGGSGGGGCCNTAGGKGTDGQGYDGAKAGTNSRSGGGGGAGHAGYTYTTNPNLSGNGGEGVANDITGVNVVYGGGGGGGGSDSSWDLFGAGIGGAGGGGDGGKSTAGANGVDGLGGGGGGGGWTGSDKSGGSGGCGTMIIAIKQTDYAIVPIPDQLSLFGEIPAPGFVVTNFIDNTRWTFGPGGTTTNETPFNVAYSYGDGYGTVTASGKPGSELEGRSLSYTFRICRRVKSLTSTGSQYIDTGIVPGPTTAIETHLNTTNCANDTVLFGTGAWNASSAYYFYQSGTYNFRINSSGIGLGLLYESGVDAFISISTNASNNFFLDFGCNTSTKTVSIAYTGTGTLNIFSTSSGGQKSKITLYSFKIWQDGELVRDFVPAHCGGVAGLYDLKNGKFYWNAGTGDFVLGPYVTDIVVDKIPNQFYTGAPLTPSVVVSNFAGTALLVKDVDYTVAYENNAAVGTGKAIVTGIGAYSAVVTNEFTIYSLPAAPAFTAKSYIQHGLMNHWDALDNAGTGSFDPTARTWKDLKGNLDFALTDRAQWGGDFLEMTGYAGVAEGKTGKYLTLEIKYRNCKTRRGMPFSSGYGWNRVAWHEAFTELWFHHYNSATRKAFTVLPAPDTAISDLTVVYGAPGANYSDAPVCFYNGGTRLATGFDNKAYGNNVLNWVTSFSRASIGAADATDYNFEGRLYSIRLYNCPLSDREIAYNAAVDKVRYDGVDPAEAFNAPDMRWNAASGKVEVLIKVGTVHGAGTLSINGGGTNEWVSIGDEVYIEYKPASGEKALEWFDLPDGAPRTANNFIVDFTAEAPVSAKLQMLKEIDLSRALNADPGIEEGSGSFNDGANRTFSPVSWNRTATQASLGTYSTTTEERGFHYLRPYQGAAFFQSGLVLPAGSYTLTFDHHGESATYDHTIYSWRIYDATNGLVCSICSVTNEYRVYGATWHKMQSDFTIAEDGIYKLQVVRTANGADGNSYSLFDNVSITSDTDLHIEAEKCYPYFGEEQARPPVIVRDDEGNVLTEGVDYELFYGANNSVGVSLDNSVSLRHGNGYVAAKGLGAHYGAAGANFRLGTPIYVKPDGSPSNGGTSWDDAVDFATALTLAATPHINNEIWIAGSIVLSAADTNPKLFYGNKIFRGGFKGTESTIEEREEGAYSTIDGNGQFTAVLFRINCNAHFERLHFRGSPSRAVSKTHWGGNVFFSNCVFEENGNAVYIQGVNKSPLCQGGVYVSDSVFRNNIWTNNANGAAAIYAYQTLRVSAENSLFECNSAYNEPKSSSIVKTSAIYANTSAVELKECDFVENVAYGSTYGTVYSTGSEAKDIAQNCLFLGNRADGVNAASLGFNHSKLKNLSDVVNCTFYGNVNYTNNCCAGVKGVRGIVNIRNSIFYGNRVDFADHADCSFDVDFTLLGNDSGATYSFVNDASKLGNSMVYGDPLFVAPGDAHLLSEAGYFDSEGNLYYAEKGERSPAIDAGDPYCDYSRESSPNGSCINLGRYGNTEQASRTPASGPDVDGIPQVMILWNDPDGYSRPTVSFMMGGNGSYAARGIVYISTDSGETWEDVSGVVGGLVNGQPKEVLVPHYYIPGSTIMAKVEVIGARQTSGPAIASDVVRGTLPPWYGKVPHNVIHVNPDAKGNNDGTSWLDAFTSWADALKELSGVKNEIWIAGTNLMTETMATKSLSFPVVIRGGFTGVELSADERPEGTYSTFDGANNYDLFKFSNADGCPLVVERLIFTRAGQYAFVNSGSGALSVINCQFISNLAPKGDVTGRGVNLSGSFTASFTNCVWRGNMKTAGGSSQAQGSAIYANGLSRLFLDDCLFITNGMSATGGIGFNTPGRDQCNGDCLWMSGTPITARNCHFRGNRGGTRSGTNGTISGTGGVILLAGASGNSAFTNCTFAGNWGGYAESKITTDAMGTSGGALDIRLSTEAGKVDFERCTLAYNLFDTRYCPGGLNVERGTVTMHNSIIFGNVRGKNTTAGHDIHVMADGRLSLSHCWLTEEDGETAGKPSSNYVSEASAGLITYNNLMFGDPLLATSLEDFESNVLTSGDFTYMRNNTAGANFIANINVHLRGGAGYFDENTGARVMDYRGSELSPAVDAGDPKADYSKEPVTQDGWHGKRVNLGAYGNTPWATSTKFLGAVYYIR